jgi:hypothetical protein
MLISGTIKQNVTSKIIWRRLLDATLRDDVIRSRRLQMHREAPTARYLQE